MECELFVSIYLLIKYDVLSLQLLTAIIGNWYLLKISTHLNISLHFPVIAKKVGNLPLQILLFIFIFSFFINISI